jgi:lipopolysaccharide/colanic/teichoic acid biosynthesis glycosyltransferase
MSKRIIDFSLTALAWVFFSPLLILLTGLIRLSMGRGVFFKQVRSGLNGKPFVIYKFRTMSDCSDENGCMLPDAERITSFGKWLRSTSLDELPELYNVLKGDMSIVGPRPLLMQYLDRYTPEQTRRHEVKPGITGLAQISGRNSLTWEEKFKLDVWYVDNRSIWLDFKILFNTIVHLIQRKGISHEGYATMPEFFPKN